ncbi:MAG: hypothetical protein F6K28_41590, partial [Microcoleus sp. SIO2G3]|nr:hypothetical protein [Microcoleus sp. SIO2G3]
MFSSRWFKTLAAIACLSTISPSALAVQIAQAPAAIDCHAERTETTIRSINEQIDRALQLVNDRQTEAATQALIAALQAVNRLEDPQAKAVRLDQMINSIPANPSVLEQLINQASPQQRQQVVAVLPQAVQVA